MISVHPARTSFLGEMASRWQRAREAAAAAATAAAERASVASSGIRGGAASAAVGARRWGGKGWGKLSTSAPAATPSHENSVQHEDSNAQGGEGYDERATTASVTTPLTPPRIAPLRDGWRHNETRRRKLLRKLSNGCFGERKTFRSRYEVASSTPLQMLVYFNIFASCIWGIGWILLFNWKVSVWDAPIYVIIVVPVMYFAWAVIEPIRLALGYLGNLHERVAWLGPFIILTVAPQMVVHIFFLVGQSLMGWFTLEIELIFSLGFFLLYIVQIVVAWQTSKRFISKAAGEFELQPVSEIVSEIYS